MKYLHLHFLLASRAFVVPFMVLLLVLFLTKLLKYTLIAFVSNGIK